MGDLAPVKVIRPAECTDIDCTLPGVVVVADGVLLCSEDALEWYERDRVAREKVTA